MSEQTGYRTDIAYTAGYYEHQAPNELNLVAAINGTMPVNLEGEFTYCELGCGHGLTTNLLAAANANGRFWGVDFNPEHIANANNAAQRFGIGNVNFVCGDFLDLEKENLPQFDFITLHGVWSWVGPEFRDAIREFISRHLKPGGLVMISYNAMPGWSSIMPLREMMITYVKQRRSELSALDQVKYGLAYLKHMKEKGAAFFANHPSAAKKLDELLTVDPRYVAHEYFNEHWHPFFFSEVAYDLRRAGLAFTGSHPAISNYSELIIPEALRDFFASSPDRDTYETHKDFVLDTKFRRDVFVKGSAIKTVGPEIERTLGAIRFALLCAPDEVNLKGRLANVEFDLTGSLVVPLLQALAQGPGTAAEIAVRQPLAGARVQDVLVVLQQLSLTGQIVSIARQHAPPMTSGDEGAGALPAVNDFLLRSALIASESEMALMSPVIGSTIRTQSLHVLGVAALASAGRDGAAAWCNAYARRAGVSLSNSDPNGGDGVQNLINSISDASLQRFRHLGVLN